MINMTNKLKKTFNTIKPTFVRPALPNSVLITHY